MSKHTPGPWTVVEDPEDRGRYVVAGPDQVGIVMTPAGKHRNEPLRSFLADARLIAAAPDLLQALKAVVGRDNPPAGEPGHVYFSDALKMAAQAIAKAEGK